MTPAPRPGTTGFLTPASLIDSSRLYMISSSENHSINKQVTLGSSIKDSGGLPIRQCRQLPKAWHVAEARLLQNLEFSDIILEFMKRKSKKTVLLNHFLHSFIYSKHSVLFFCSMFLPL